MAAQPHTATETILGVTEEAIQRILGFRAGAPEPEGQGMWVEVTGSAGDEYTYAMALRPLVSARRSDVVQRVGELAVVVPTDAVDKVRGATVDWSEGPEGGGLTLRNPNKPPAPAPATLNTLPMAGGPGPAPAASPAMGGAPADLSGPLAQRVQQVLQHQINPAIASHGGVAELVAVEEGAAYLRLGGGCQGCGMATVTLSQGIEVAIREAVPEVERVVDVTDHASGSNPYFEAAKK